MHAQGDHERQDGGHQRHGQPAQGVVQAQDGSGQQRADVVAQGAQQEQPHREGHRKAEQGHKEHADGLGAPLVAPFFQKRHEDDDQDRGEHLAGVADVLQGDAEEGGPALGAQQRGGGRGDHGGGQRHGDQLVAAELGGGGKGDQHRQVVQRGVGHIIKDLVDHVGGREQPEGGAQRQQRLEDARARDGRDQRLEDAHQIVQDDAADVLLAAGSRRGRLGGVEGAQLEQFVIDFDHVVADDHLALGPAADDAHDAGGLFQRGHVGLAGVRQREAQPGGAVFQLRYVFLAADQTQNVRGSLLVVFHG